MSYEKLQMTADTNEGSFVRNLQGKEGVGFAENTHVHKDWWATTISYDDAMEILQRGKDEREDIMAPVKNIEAVVTDDGDFAFDVDGREFVPTDWALQQFSIRSKVPSSTVIQKLRSQEDADGQDSEVMAYLANNSLRRLDQDKVYRMRTYTDGTCRAFVTDKYAPIDNRWYLDQIREILPEGRLSHWRGDEDTIFGNVLLPDTIIDYGQSDDSDYGGMLSIGNCEIGKRRISQVPSLFRSICLNGCIWGECKGKEIKKRHIGEIDLSELSFAIYENIEAQLPLLDMGVRKLLGLQSMEVQDAKMRQVFATVAMDHKLTKKEVTEVFSQWATYERQDKNLFGVVNAVTRAGQTLNNMSWVRFDQVGGQLMDTSESRWASILTRAESLQDKDLEKVYGVSA
jgi:hypothetical protein|tara:strand:+ start:2175 stop:3374 length:1200 start_codon:yes stop_codon:yes gene_type:complete